MPMQVLSTSPHNADMRRGGWKWKEKRIQERTADAQTLPVYNGAAREHKTSPTTSVTSPSPVELKYYAAGSTAGRSGQNRHQDLQWQKPTVPLLQPKNPSPLWLSKKGEVLRVVKRENKKSTQKKQIQRNRKPLEPDFVFHQTR